MNIEDMRRLLNTLSLVETKGQSSITMAQCLQYIEQKIREAEANLASSENATK